MVSYDDKDRYTIQREQMIRTDLRGRGITDPRVLAMMGRIPREAFLTENYHKNAYEDNPLPIGMGQTISQPYIVALMTQSLRLKGEEEVLEIGTGSGYQTAILAGLCRQVWTVERFGELSARAQAVLGRLCIDNVEYAIGDGSEGWPEDRRFDRIIITAAVPEVPEPLDGQLKDGGLMVAPLGDDWTQMLTLIEKKDGRLCRTPLTACRFVRLIGRYGFSE
jgi:protein-L-isoaspartate(D-aspartate) O-methyltransferase